MDKLSNQWEIYVEKSREFSLNFEKNKFTDSRTIFETQIAIRFIYKKRLLFFSFEALDKKKFENALKFAKKHYKYFPSVEFEFKAKGRAKDTCAFDKNIFGFDLKDFEKEIKKAKQQHAIINESGLEISQSNIKIINSNGLDLDQKKSFMSFYAETIYKNTNAGYWDSAYYFKNDLISQVIEKAILSSKNMSKAKKPKMKKIDVVFADELLAEFVDFLMYLLSFNTITTNASRFSKKLNEKILDEKISISSNPNADLSMKTRFDSEGNKTKKRTIIKNGILKHYFYDAYSWHIAKQNNLEKEQSKLMYQWTLRHSVNQPPHADLINLEIEKGDAGKDEIYSNVVLIKSAHGFHTINAVNGDFSLQVEEAYYFDKKSKKKPIRNFVINGNLFNMFLNTGLVSRYTNKKSNICVPDIRFKNLKLIF